MAGSRRARSFEADSAHSVTLPSGQVAHRAHVEQSQRLARSFSQVRQGVWCLVGNGLSNQTFIEGPDGIIAIDTGESIEEMNEALGELRQVTSKPVVAVMYTHFHYVAGTRAVLDSGAAKFGQDTPIWGHERIAENRRRTASEIGTAYGRGLVEQFAIMLPESGPDGNVNVGLGNFYRNPAHAPFTNGFVVPTHTFAEPTTITVAGLEIEVTPAPSDADDSVTYWFKSLGVAVNNLVWPVLFNIFAIRGEEYRDPRVMLRGLDHLLSLGAQHLVGAHGPHISGAVAISERVTKYRDSIQLLWDQTVRATNMGLTSTEVAQFVDLPAGYDDDYLTSELYGVVEHHARQIRSGLFGFFDGDEANLFPTPPRERATRLVAGMGGRDSVRSQVVTAIDADDLRWALELGSWLVRSDGAQEQDRKLLARALRLVAQRTPAANIRGWCLTRALSLEGAINTERLRTHRLREGAVVSGGYDKSVHILRVLLDPQRAEGVNVRLSFVFDGAHTTGLHIRNSVAVPTDGDTYDVQIKTSLATWAKVVSGAVTLSRAISDKTVAVDGGAAQFQAAMACFDIESLRS